jgi:ribose transport system ATP-binding protein
LQLADKVTVLRDGLTAAAGLSTTGVTEQELARHMLGRAVGAVHRGDRQPLEAQVGARVEGLTGAGVYGLSLTVRRGEVVGLTGLPGTGFESVPKLLTGAVRATAGTVTTARASVDLTHADVATCLEAGVALVPEKRIFEGLALELSIRDNMAVPSLRRRGKPWFVGRGWQDRGAREAIRALSINTRSTRTLAKELSGGNQQKVLLAKWLSVRPDLLVLHEPTQAVDVGARVDILRTLRATAAEGTGVLLVSIEPTDLVEACDRILVLGRDGSVRELRTRDADDVLDAIYSETTTTARAS